MGSLRLRVYIKFVLELFELFFLRIILRASKKNNPYLLVPEDEPGDVLAGLELLTTEITVLSNVPPRVVPLDFVLS